MLHPWKGIDVLCKGSVMQYYEFESAEPMTDKQWESLLDSPESPGVLDWFADFAGRPQARPAGGPD